MFVMTNSVTWAHLIRRLNRSSFMTHANDLRSGCSDGRSQVQVAFLQKHRVSVLWDVQVNVSPCWTRSWMTEDWDPYLPENSDSDQTEEETQKGKKKQRKRRTEQCDWFTCADWLVSPVPSRSSTSRVLLDATATASIPAIRSPGNRNRWEQQLFMNPSVWTGSPSSVLRTLKLELVQPIQINPVEPLKLNKRLSYQRL